MKETILILILGAIAIIPNKVTLEDGREIAVHCFDTERGVNCVFKELDNDACYDPVTKRWGPCY
jgi:hypothetical protein